MWEHLFVYLVFYFIILFFVFFNWIRIKNINKREKIFISLLSISYVIHFFYIYPSFYFFWFLIYDFNMKMNLRSYRYKFYFFIFVFFIYSFIGIQYSYCYIPFFILLDFIFTNFLYFKNYYDFNIYKDAYAFIFEHKLEQCTNNFIFFSFFYLFYEFTIQNFFQLDYISILNFYELYKDYFLLSNIFIYNYGFFGIYFMLILNILQLVFLDRIILCYSNRRILI